MDHHKSLVPQMRCTHLLAPRAAIRINWPTVRSGRECLKDFCLMILVHFTGKGTFILLIMCLLLRISLRFPGKTPFQKSC